MKERPIIFNADMVRAVLDGRKTQTRRIMRVQPDSAGFESRFIIDSTKRSEIGKWCWAEPGVFVNPRRSALFSCPFGENGDRLWVRESFYEHGHWQGGGYDPEDSYFVSDKQVLYPADGIQRPAERKREDFWRSRPSIHMPRWASRITLEITGVRVERLNSINEHDAIAEGLAEISKDGRTYKYGIPDRDGYPGTDDFGWPWHEWERYPISAYSKLWKSIYGADSWQANPWVWVIEFKRVEVE
ncbi:MULTISPECIES: hypothetical protein [unclassified Pantoea]|uniref:hypothetical protein n=1 Tax=unclassified Pantoea TaxID=2630326 RepID=UPI0023DA6F1A|nr:MULTISPECIES: hypothetical protein [unclassified Pantoea]MDF2040859.1 hypothetical protein [Pantoea sp. Cr_R14]MDF2071266.1 hypothetical protein [Pantoea sp. Cr_R13]MDF2080395.1 hypothetical protein [Pantoea sp. Cr_R21]